MQSCPLRSPIRAVQFLYRIKSEGVSRGASTLPGTQEHARVPVL